VVDTNPSTLAEGTATGFSFAAYSAAVLREEPVQRALVLFRTDRERWLSVGANGMRQELVVGPAAR